MTQHEKARLLAAIGKALDEIETRSKADADHLYSDYVGAGAAFYSGFSAAIDAVRYALDGLAELHGAEPADRLTLSDALLLQHLNGMVRDVVNEVDDTSVFEEGHREKVRLLRARQYAIEEVIRLVNTLKGV